MWIVNCFFEEGRVLVVRLEYVKELEMGSENLDGFLGSLKLEDLRNPPKDESNVLEETLTRFRSTQASWTTNTPM